MTTMINQQLLYDSSGILTTKNIINQQISSMIMNEILPTIYVSKKLIIQFI